MRYDMILWDVDGTLLNFRYSQKLSLESCLTEIGVTATEEMVEAYDKINEGWWQRLERGEVTKRQLLSGRFLDFFQMYGIACQDVEHFLNRYETNLGEIFTYQEDSLEICKELQGKCRQSVVTNGVTAPQLNKLRHSGFLPLMEKVFISEQLGAPKPQSAFFDRVFEELPDVERERTLIVGDSLSSDMRGGENAGIATCWYNPEGLLNQTGIRIDHEIRSLREVIRIVEG